MESKEPEMIERLQIEARIRTIKNENVSNPRFVSQMFGGMSNKSYIYETDGLKMIIHESTRGADRFVRRKYERDAYSHLVGCDFVQQPLYLKRHDEKFRIFRYIEGVSMNTINYADYLPQICACLKSLHQNTERFNFEYNPYQYLDFLIKGVTGEVDKLFYRGLNLVESYREELVKRHTCPCHNDCQPSNLILSPDGKVTMIDFEFAANNDYVYDIASFGNLNFNDAIDLLSLYNPTYNNDDLKALFVWRIFIDLQWYLIAMKKFELGYNDKFNIDFKEIGLFFLNKITPLIEAVESGDLVGYQENKDSLNV